jgi:hypothetical protein
MKLLNPKERVQNILVNFFLWLHIIQVHQIFYNYQRIYLFYHLILHQKFHLVFKDYENYYFYYRSIFQVYPSLFSFSIKPAIALHLCETLFFSSSLASPKDLCKSSDKNKQSYPKDLSQISSSKIVQ